MCDKGVHVCVQGGRKLDVCDKGVCAWASHAVRGLQCGRSRVYIGVYKRSMKMTRSVCTVGLVCAGDVHMGE